MYGLEKHCIIHTVLVKSYTNKLLNGEKQCTSIVKKKTVSADLSIQNSKEILKWVINVCVINIVFTTQQSPTLQTSQSS